mmetsp:Transcript_7938/g.10467  ORF Transcript_7938/g.10467 Transcript_7938/m.10467 type:complete len:374 (+) Transcript_7938:68-1189(+)
MVGKNLCQEKGCTNESRYGYKGKLRILCGDHKLPGMVNSKNRICESSTCIKTARFNYAGLKSGRFCMDHRLKDMTNVKGGCLHYGCTKSASYGWSSERSRIYCLDHKSPGMVGLKNTVCDYEGCSKRPSYYETPDLKGEKFCAEHRKDGMHCRRPRSTGDRSKPSKRQRLWATPDLRNQCREEGCTKQASFNYPGEVKRKFCAKHALDGMHCMMKKTCKFEGCTTQASYNHPDLKERRFCFKHKAPWMVHVVNSKCLHPGCRERPRYNYEDCSRGAYCGDHYLQGMKDLTAKRNCAAGGCHRKVPGGKGIFCGYHQLGANTQVKIGGCEHVECGRRATYRFDGDREWRLCTVHKLAGMRSMMPRAQSDPLFMI